MVIWLVSAGLQFFNDGLLIVGFASAVGVLIQFVLLENPEANLERSLGCFNAYALSEYAKQLSEWHKAVAILDLEEFLNFQYFVRTEYRNDYSNLILIEQSMIEKYKAKYLVEQEIADALAQDRVEVFFQPIYSAAENRFTCAEALVRIRKTDGSLLPPGMFIPIAENNGQILELGERVFEKVCHFLKESDAIRCGIKYIELNLSVVQCERADLAEHLIAITERYQVDPRYINLEITETASISAKNILLDNMRQLIDYGFTFSLDDFGKGESNLMYVVDMPVSFVKLDYELSKAYFHSEKAKHVVRGVIEMAHGMNLKLVAEGIETSEENDGMIREGIDYIQGFYYSRPIPEHDFLEFLKARAIDK